MILPVFSLYAGDFKGATPILTGLAIGIYGLTQGLFQLPFGFLSDRFGRKRMIVFGLMIFCLGSLVAANAETIYQVIAGRALQGVGAIAAVVMALAADLTREEVRLRIMAMIGISIGVSFMISMVMGPIIAAEFGLSLIFWITAGLSILGILVIVFITPKPPSTSFHREAQLSLLDVGKIVRNKELLKLDLGIFVLHTVLSATFVVFPLMLKNILLVDRAVHWQTYLPVFLLSAVFFVPMIIVAEKFNKSKPIFLLAIAFLAIAELGLSRQGGYSVAFAMLVLFFTAFNFLEAVLPSTVAKIAPADMKGTAMGLYSSSQFFGAFSGGLLGGFLYSLGDYGDTFLGLSGILGVWFVIALSMKTPRALSSRVISLKQLKSDQIAQFIQRASGIKGVYEISVYEDDGVAYLKVERGFNDGELRALAEGEPLPST